MALLNYLHGLKRCFLLNNKVELEYISSRKLDIDYKFYTNLDNDELESYLMDSLNVPDGSAASLLVNQTPVMDPSSSNRP